MAPIADAEELLYGGNTVIESDIPLVALSGLLPPTPTPMDVNATPESDPMSD